MEAKEKLTALVRELYGDRAEIEVRTSGRDAEVRVDGERRYWVTARYHDEEPIDMIARHLSRAVEWKRKRSN